MLYPSFGGRLRSLVQRSWRTHLFVVLTLLMLLCNANSPLVTFFTAPPAYAATNGKVKNHPNRFDPHSQATSLIHPVPVKTASTTVRPPKGTLTHKVQVPMKPGSLPLQAGQPAHFVGSDGALQVDVPATAITTADLAQLPAGGAGLHLQITQILPAAGSSAGGSGYVTFGTYLFQLVDASGKPLTHGLHQPVTLTFRPGKASAFDLAHATLSLNLALTADVAPQAASTLGKPVNLPLTFDRGHQTLTAQVTMATASTSATFNSNSPIASFGKPDPFNTDLNAGALSFSLPIDVPSGPGGLTPPVTLAYSSESVAEAHRPRLPGWARAGPWIWARSVGPNTMRPPAPAGTVAPAGKTPGSLAIPLGPGAI
jgi:hypothetical protein